MTNVMTYIKKYWWVIGLVAAGITYYVKSKRKKSTFKRRY